MKMTRVRMVVRTKRVRAKRVRARRVRARRVSTRRVTRMMSLLRKRRANIARRSPIRRRRRRLRFKHQRLQK